MKIKLTHFPLYTAAITLLVTVIVIWTYNIKLNSQYFIEQQTKLEEFHIKKNVQALKTLLQSQQFDEVKRLVSEISVSQYISHIHVFSSDFVFVASNKISNEGKLLLDVDSNLFHRLEQVTRNQFPQNSKQELFRKLDVYTSSLDKKIYYLYLDFELLSIYDTFQKQTVNSIILFTICITVIALFFYLASKSTLKRRIKKLQRTIVSYYDGNNSVRYNPKKNSDFIELELLLNAMFDLVEHEQQLMQEEKAFSNTVLSSTTDGIIVIDDKGQIVLVNQQALSIFKYENQEELIGKNVLCLVPSEFHLMHVEIFEKQKHNTPQTHGILNKIRDISGVTKDGESFPISITVATNIQQGKRYYSAFVKDLTQTQQYERSIESLAYFDELTGLFNINGIIRHTEVREQKATLCLIELNHTRTINEAYDKVGKNY